MFIPIQGCDINVPENNFSDGGVYSCRRLSVNSGNVVGLKDKQRTGLVSKGIIQFEGKVCWNLTFPFYDGIQGLVVLLDC